LGGSAARTRIAVRKLRRGRFAEAAVLADIDRIDDVEGVVALDWRLRRGNAAALTRTLADASTLISER
jgi:hypothetical protein